MVFFFTIIYVRISKIESVEQRCEWCLFTIKLELFYIHRTSWSFSYCILKNVFCYSLLAWPAIWVPFPLKRQTPPILNFPFLLRQKEVLPALHLLLSVLIPLLQGELLPLYLLPLTPSFLSFPSFSVPLLSHPFLLPSITP